MRSLTDNLKAMVDIGIVLTIGIAFAGLAVIAYIIWALRDMLLPDDPGSTTTAAYNQTHAQIGNITSGFDSAFYPGHSHKRIAHAQRKIINQKWVDKKILPIFFYFLKIHILFIYYN